MRRNVCMMRCWPAMRPVKPTRNRRPLRSRPDFCSSVTDTSAQNVLTAMALGEQLFDELEHILPRVASSRPHLLPDGDGALCAG